MKKSKTDGHLTKQLFDSHKRFIGCLMKMDDNSIVIGLNNKGDFVGRFDGENTYLLPSNDFFCNGDALYELILKKFVEN